MDGPRSNAGRAFEVASRLCRAPSRAAASSRCCDVRYHGWMDHAVVAGVLHGNAILLDAAVPALDGRRVRVIICRKVASPSRRRMSRLAVGTAGSDGGSEVRSRMSGSRSSRDASWGRQMVPSRCSWQATISLSVPVDVLPSLSLQ